MTTLPQKL
jgi:hypothetical protein